MFSLPYSRISENYYGVIAGLFSVMLFAIVILLLWGIPVIAEIFNRI